jgi:hypothetical protein
MAIIQGPTDSFMKESWQAIHDLEDDVLKIALYTSDASLGPETTAYTATEEISGSGYTAGGATLTGGVVTVNQGVAYADFSDASWASATLSDVMGAMIYNSSKSNRSVWVLNFGLARTVSNQTFQVKFPVAGFDTAIIRMRR